MKDEPIFRRELKYRVCALDREMLICRLEKALTPDVHGKKGVYHVRTLYFDTLYDNALRESLAGDAEKTKIRLRMYNLDDSFLRLEKKIKTGEGGMKVGACLTRAECDLLLSGSYDFLRQKENPFFRECYALAENGCLRPRTIVQYTRAAFGCVPGNVRITIDSAIRACAFVDRFFDPHLGGSPLTTEDTCVLEVKYDRFLPDYIPHLIGIGDRERSAFSKYALGREYY